ncbi:hypothetical protein M9434_006190 [Picochlorum sp. BPE23]|nr:hypothetical protein M9434_006190 [Picochlorum sp. BPE23]KAI8108853.1 hypothetical protein M9435_005270 [Picochlorum sp. BPE23]WPT14060.1 N-terminal acetyltransferase B complex catalytic subunit NAA20 [Picochlorum sp. SENEW3]
MTTIRRFSCRDLFKFAQVNLDYFTETYNVSFYLQYLARWPEYCLMAESVGYQRTAYILGKVEGEGKSWHGHVTAVTVSPTYRKQGIARQLMDTLEDVTANRHNGYFVDLFVRASNKAAISMYEKLGYSTYRTVLGYYSNDENALDMRKAMPRDVRKESIVPLSRPVRPEELEFD